MSKLTDGWSAPSLLPKHRVVALREEVHRHANGAVIDGIYRYALWRTISTPAGNPVPGARVVTFVMLNPSTADARGDDPTVRRCMGFAYRRGFAKLVIVNLYAFRATSPLELRMFAGDPIGEHNDKYIDMACAMANVVVYATGATRGPGFAKRRGDFLSLSRRRDLYCLGRTKGGSPRHPLYLKGSTPLELWRAALSVQRWTIPSPTDEENDRED